MKNNKKLYNSIMKDVSKIIKENLEDMSLSDLEDGIVAKINSLQYGKCTIYEPFDDDYYEVYTNNGEFLCTIPYDTDIYDEDAIEAAIDININD